jgi:hypothetical protein
MSPILSGFDMTSRDYKRVDSGAEVHPYIENSDIPIDRYSPGKQGGSSVHVDGVGVVGDLFGLSITSDERPQGLI